MTTTRRAVALLCLVAFAGCGLQAERTRRRTLPGVTPDRAFAAARRAVAEQGLEVDVAEPAEGTLITAWQDRPQHSVRYEVSVEGGGEGGASVVVRAERRDRAVRGWSAGYPWPSAAGRLLSAVERVVDEVPEVETPEEAEAGAAAPPECSTSRQCPPGQHCTGRGRCVWECATDEECEAGARCDRRGRCVEPPPAPPPCPEAAPVTGADGE